ncbi:MAG: TRAP transporter substrate-binding protein, partial [Sphaerochaetaceae bacterium]|nr:TRAP transporter substrate-binding protein [Sphaerochaetaceae bacterium]
MKKKMVIVSIILLVVFSCLLYANGEEEQQQPAAQEEVKQSTVAEPAEGSDLDMKYTLKFSWADPFDPLKQSTSAYAVVFKQEVERLSGGQIKVELYPAGQIGDQRSSTEQVARGTIEMTNISSGVLASLYFPKLEIVDMPFLFTSREHATRVLDVVNNPVMSQMNEELIEETGIRLLNVIPFGPRHLTNNVRQVRTPADVEGLRIRTMEIIPHMKLIEAMGGSPVPIPFLELYTSLQTNVVDGEENTFQNIIAQNFFEVQKYLTVTNHVMGVGATLINEEWFMSLPEYLRAAVIEADYVAQMVYNGVGQVLDAMAVDTLVEEGMDIYYPTPAE